MAMPALTTAALVGVAVAMSVIATAALVGLYADHRKTNYTRSL